MRAAAPSPGSMPAARTSSSAVSAPSPSRASSVVATWPSDGATFAARLEPEDLEHVVGAGHRCRTEPEQRIRARRERARDLTRDGEHIASLLEREVGGDERAAPLPCLDHDRRPTQAGDDPVPSREAPRGRLDAGLVLGDDESRLADATSQLRVCGRVVAVDAATENCNGRSTGVERTTMRLAVDPSSHPAHDDEAGGREVARERARDRASVRGARTRTDDGHGGPIEEHARRRAAKKELRRWIVDRREQ